MTRSGYNNLALVVAACATATAYEFQQEPCLASFTPAYVGQPLPGTIYWGAAISGNGDPYARHEQYVGQSLSIRRTYYQWNDRTSTYLTSRLADDHLNNRLSWISFKTPAWDLMASGDYDSQIDQMLNTLRDSAGTIWLTIWHEPENDLNIGSSADHVAMNQRVRQRINSLGISNVALAANLMAWTWNPGSGRNPDSWWAPDLYDLLGVDIYSGGGTLLKNEWYDLREWAAEKGVDVAVAEWGITGDSGTHVRPWYEHAIGSYNDGNGARVVALSNFDSNLNGGHELAGEQLQIFRELMLDPRTTRVNTLSRLCAAYDADTQTPAPSPASMAGGSWIRGGLNSNGVVEHAGQEANQNHWEILDDNSGGTLNSSVNYAYPLIPADLNATDGWTATAVVKVLSASNTPSGVTFEVRGGGQLVNLSFVHDGANEFVGQSVGGNTAIIPIQNLDLDRYNTFQLYFDPADQLVDLYINGRLTNTITPGSSALSRVLWGSNTSAATGLAHWRGVRFETGFAVNSSLLGDYNYDGDVDAADYTVWRDSLGQTGDNLAADGNNDQKIDRLDYDLWKMGFGNSVSANGTNISQQTVPEPSALLLGSAVLLAVNVSMARRRVAEVPRNYVEFPKRSQVPLECKNDG